MQLVRNGPDIPIRIIQQLEDGRLIFFCGAGVSYPAGLPGFRDLVIQCYKALGELMNSEEKQAFDTGFFDRTFGLLEDRIGAVLVRKTIIELLKISPNPSILSTHSALLDLAKAKDGTYRLVTTNFDTGFQLAGPTELVIDRAPMLPVPKQHKWNGIVHLHGQIHDGDKHGLNLVLTSADFGAAYLTERWASRFLGELFRRYNVIFVGYSVEDSVVRYMMDALAADRRKGDEQTQSAYVLAPSSARGAKKANRSWEARGLDPVLYNKRSNHSLLHRTLKAWGALQRDGLTGKERIVQGYAPNPPVRPYDEAVSQVIWALSEPSGHIARLFLDLSPSAPLAWLEVLDEAGLLSGGQKAHPIVPLVDGPHRTLCPAPLSPTASYLGNWVTTYLGETAVLQWVIRKGGCLHPEMRYMVRERLKKGSLDNAMRSVWEMMCSDAYACSCRNRSELLELRTFCRKRPWDSLLRHQVLEALSLKVKFGAPWISSLKKSSQTSQTVPVQRRVRDLVEVKLAIAAGDYADSLLDDVRGLGDAVLADLLDGATSILIAGWSLLGALDLATRESDLSYIHQPSISEHPQNRGFEDWTKIVDLLRDAWHAAVRCDRTTAMAALARWKSVPFPLFRRLFFFGVSESDLVSPSEVVEHLLENDGWWLWSIETQRELFRLFSSIAPCLDSVVSQKLAEAIEIGPPESMFDEQVKEPTYQWLADRERWLLLKKLEAFGWALPKISRIRLAEIGARYPDWHLQVDDRDEFPTWMDSGWGNRTEYSADQLRSSSEAEIADLLRNTKEPREGLMDVWRQVVREDAHKAFLILKLLAADEQWPADVWRASLDGLSDEKVDVGSWQELAVLLVNAPESLLGETAWSIAWWLRRVVKASPLDHEERYWPVWDRLIEVAIAKDVGTIESAVAKALNSPAGILTESIMDRVWARKPKVGQGLDETLKPRLTRIAGSDKPSLVMCHVILSMRLNVLFQIDRGWCKLHLLPYFRWGSAESNYVWQGYLHSPRIDPDLLAELRVDLLRAMKDREALKEYGRQLFDLFTISSLEFPDGFAPMQIRKAIRATDPDGRRDIANSLFRRVAEAGSEGQAFWENRAGPWLEKYWPKDESLKEVGSSRALALAAVAAGSAFPKAVEVIQNFLVPFDDVSYVIHRMENAKVNGERLAVVEPAAALSLLDKIIADDSPWPHGDWREMLELIGNRKPDLKETAAYQRLDEYLRLRNL